MFKRQGLNLKNVSRNLNRALVVDDNKDVADCLALLLREVFGVDSCAVYSGNAALKLITSFEPSLVFLDINMPEMDGYETARHIRALPQAKSVFLVALSAIPEGCQTKSGSDVFDEYFVKPLDVDILEHLFLLSPPEPERFTLSY